MSVVVYAMQFSVSVLSCFLALFGSSWAQFNSPTDFPLLRKKNFPSSPKSLPLVQKCGADLYSKSKNSAKIYKRNFQTKESVFTFAVDQIEKCSFFFFGVDGHQLHVFVLTVLISSKEVCLWIDRRKTIKCQKKNCE